MQEDAYFPKDVTSYKSTPICLAYKIIWILNIYHPFKKGSWPYLAQGTFFAAIRKVWSVYYQNLSLKFYETDLARARHLLSVTTEVVSVSSLVMDATATVDAV